ncbi:hypothetical protein [Streptomyces agglomeratus]|uniref:hypothetical protein n=1 Tax=Streptomyces agglomeratus TaxID=285458 RepID=UPI00114CB6B3|nr:hypothetical protein [Streptomyces agglomeratus]
MSLEEPLPAASDPDPYTAAAHRVAEQWAELDPEKFDLALKALEPRSKRAHQFRLRQLAMQEVAAKLAADDVIAKRHHTYQMTNLIVAAMLSLAMLGGGIYVAPTNIWLALGLCGPSLLALMKVFVLRRSDASDMRNLGRFLGNAGNAGPPPQPPSPPAGPGGPIP